MAWISENWLLLLFIGGMVAMHLFGHGHGGHKHGKNAKHQKGAEKDTSDASAGTQAPSEDD